MKTLIPGQKKILKIWIPPKKAEVGYRLLTYIMICTVEDGVLMCNTVTGSLILLSFEEYECLHAGFKGYESLFNQLIENHFLVPQSYDDAKTVNQIRDVMIKLDANNTILSYNILPTTYCNARCFYCYQSDFRHIHMDNTVMNRLVEFMIHNDTGKKIHIGWFGGEPLVGKKYIYEICSKLQDAGIEYSSSMVSNGYLFDADLVNQAKEIWKLTKVQITLDGTEEIYNKTKAYVGVSDNPYKRVLDNIDMLSEAEIQIDIRLNLDFHNLENIEALIDELADRFSGNQYVGVYIHALFEGTGYEPVVHDSREREYLETERLRLEKRLRECHLSLDKSFQLPQLKYYHCMADNPHCVQCSPDGILSKCEHFVYEHTVGTLESGLTDSENKKFWQQRENREECMICPLMPSCLKLKNCPGSIRSCLLRDKEWKTERCKENMINTYNRWKQKET